MTSYVWRQIRDLWWRHRRVWPTDWRHSQAVIEWTRWTIHGIIPSGIMDPWNNQSHLPRRLLPTVSGRGDCHKSVRIGRVSPPLIRSYASPSSTIPTSTRSLLYCVDQPTWRHQYARVTSSLRPRDVIVTPQMASCWRARDDSLRPPDVMLTYPWRHLYARVTSFVVTSLRARDVVIYQP